MTSMEADPAPVAVLENNSLPGSLLVIVTTTPPPGAAPLSGTLAAVSRPWPTAKFGGTSPAGPTPTVSVLAPAAGRLKSAGTRAVTVVLPVLTELAVNCVLAL